MKKMTKATATFSLGTALWIVGVTLIFSENHLYKTLGLFMFLIGAILYPIALCFIFRRRE